MTGDLRRDLAARFLRGDGIEIGALQNPLPVPQSARVRYVDRLTVDEARAHYPELEGQPLVEPAIIAECDRLETIATSSLDFVVCNHVLEHVRDPVSALREWLRVLRRGGYLYVAIPDCDNPFDRSRPVTAFDHLLADVRGFDSGYGRDSHDQLHYDEWVRATRPDLPVDAQRSYAAQLAAQRYAIHFHVFDEALFRRLLEKVAGWRHSLVAVAPNRLPDTTEYVAIVRKRGAGPRDALKRCAQLLRQIRHA